MKVAIAGASGYTGVELFKVLQQYEDIEINQITSRTYQGKTLKEVFPFFIKSRYQDLVFKNNFELENSDIYFLCLPHEPSIELVYNLYKKGKKVIDLSAAYRIKNLSAYPEYYGFNHSHPEILEKAVYGLPEIFREEIKSAEIIANPGCYPTATLLGLYPLIREKLNTEDSIVVNAMSGISGAGRKLKEDFHFPEAFGNAYAYSPKNHRHIPEMENVIEVFSGQKVKIRFTPHILPVSRGMISSISVKTDMNEKDLKELYFEYYKNEPFIRLVETPSKIKNVSGTNFCDIFVSKDERTGFTIIISVIDNLGKGASLQAVQNFNLLIGKKETENLLNFPVWPWFSNFKI